jgi:hypothetical protein
MFGSLAQMESKLLERLLKGVFGRHCETDAI